MHFRVLTVGRIKSSYVRAGVADYAKRLSHYCAFDLVETRAKAVTREAEGEILTRHLQPESYRLALAVQGKTFSSEAFARLILRLQMERQKTLDFLIGGPLGLAPKVLQQAHLLLSLSPMTLPHEVCALVLLEQLYRAHTILRKEPYHK